MREDLKERDMILCEIEIPKSCVNCDSFLPAEQHESLMMINPEGEAVVCQGPVVFCPKCKHSYASEAYFLKIANDFGFNPFLLVGFMDLDQIPEDKRHLQLGEDPSLPIPLMDFGSCQALKKASFEDQI